MALVAVHLLTGVAAGTLTTSSAGPDDTTFATVDPNGLSVVETGPRPSRIQVAKVTGSPAVAKDSYSARSAGGISFTWLPPVDPPNGFSMLTVKPATGTCFRVNVLISGAVRVLNSANSVAGSTGNGTVVYDGTVTYRIEITWTHSGGTLQLQVFNDSTNVQQGTTISLSGASIGANHTEVHWGIESATSEAPTFYFDDLLVEDTATVPTPPSSPIIKALPTATSTDTAVPLGRNKALPTATSTATAQTITRAAARTLPVATTSDAGLAPGSSKTKAAPVAAETDTAVAITSLVARQLPVALETDAAVTPGRSKTRPVTTATTTALARALRPGKTLAAPVAAETDAAINITRGAARALPTANTSLTALAFGRSRQRALPTVTEASAAVAIAGRSKVRALVTAGVTGTALAFVRSKVRALFPAAETSTAQAIAGGSNVIVRDITVTVGDPYGHALEVDGPTRHPLTIGAPTGHPLAVQAPRS